MAKRHENEARQRAREFERTVHQRTGRDVYGGGAFGPTGIAGERQNAQRRQNQSWDTVNSYNEGDRATGGFEPGTLGPLRNIVFDNAMTGGYDPSRTNAIRDTMEERTPTGGYDPGALQNIRNIGYDFTQTGGIDPNVAGRVKEGYTDFSLSGGFTPEDSANFRRRATSGVPAIYNVLADEAERRRTTTGGLGTGGGISQMARQVSQEQARASTNAEVELANLIRQGKLAGLGGLSEFGVNEAGLRQQGFGQLRGTESDVAGGTRNLLGQRAGFEGEIASGRRAGTGQAIDLESQVAAGRRGATDVARQLFNSATGEVSDMGRQILAMYGLQDASSETQLRALTQLAGTPGILDNIQRIGGMVSGGLGAIPGI